MDYEALGGVGGVPVRVPTGDDYRRCSLCGGSCEPDPDFGSGESGARIAFVCPQHGIQSLIDPFEGLR